MGMMMEGELFWTSAEQSFPGNVRTCQNCGATIFSPVRRMVIPNDDRIDKCICSLRIGAVIEAVYPREATEMPPSGILSLVGPLGGIILNTVCGKYNMTKEKEASFSEPAKHFMTTPQTLMIARKKLEASGLVMTVRYSPREWVYELNVERVVKLVVAMVLPVKAAVC